MCMVTNDGYEQVSLHNIYRLRELAFEMTLLRNPSSIKVMVHLTMLLHTFSTGQNLKQCIQ